MSPNVSGVKQLQEYFTQKIKSDNEVGVEYRVLTSHQNILAATTVALAILTAIAGITLAGIGVVGNAAVWMMIGGGAGIALLTYVPIAICQSRFKKEIETCLAKEGVLDSVTQKIAPYVNREKSKEKYYTGLAEDRLSNQSFFYINFVNTSRDSSCIIFALNDDVNESMDHELKQSGYVFR